MFQKELPRIYELRDQIQTPTSPSAYFQDFDSSFRDHPEIQRVFRALENELQALDSCAWETLKKKTCGYLTARDAKRGWQQLFDHLNEARGYKYLKCIGCSDVYFIPESKKNGKTTPDLHGRLGSVKVLCEVKTINKSDVVIKARNEGELTWVHDRLDEEFFIKLFKVLRKAKEQLESYSADEAKTRLIIYIVINFDNWVGEYNDRYFRQIDQRLSENTITGIEIVIHNQQTPFNKRSTMNNAIIVND